MQNWEVTKCIISLEFEKTPLFTLNTEVIIFHL